VLYEHSIHPDGEDAAGVRSIGLDTEMMLLIAGKRFIELHKF
jgi:hypothetical protein